MEVVVVRYSDGFYLEDQDMFNLSGIFRDVLLYSLPKPLHINNFEWKTTIDNSTQLSTVDVLVDVEWEHEHLNFLMGDVTEVGSPHESSYKEQLRRSWVLGATLYEEGVMIKSQPLDTSHSFVFSNANSVPMASSSAYVPLPSDSMTSSSPHGSRPGSVKCVFSLTVSDAVLWSAENPYIYTLVLTLKNAQDGSTAQAESCRVAFRIIDIHNGQLRVNSRPITVKGTNIHEHDPVRGHTVSQALMEADIKLMKRHNFNAVRTSHYPHATWMYELCTLYGLFVVDEANIETHGMKPYIGELTSILTSLIVDP